MVKLEDLLTEDDFQDFKFILLVKQSNGDLESYFGDNAKYLKDYAELKKFKRFKIYELQKVKVDLIKW